MNVICCHCKKVLKDGRGPVSHGMCVECLDKHYPAHMAQEIKKNLAVHFSTVQEE